MHIACWIDQYRCMDLDRMESTSLALATRDYSWPGSARSVHVPMQTLGPSFVVYYVGV